MGKIESKDSGFKFIRLGIDLDKMHGKVVREENRPPFLVRIRHKPTAIVTDEKLDQLTESTFRALNLAHLISEECARHYTVLCTDELFGYAQGNGAVSQQLIDDDTDCQTAALLHELLENMEENTGICLINTDGIPDLAEFLFTGEKRLSYFNMIHHLHCTGQEKPEYGTYIESWSVVLDYLLDGHTFEDPEISFLYLLQKRSIPEDEKKELIKRAIKEASVLKHTS